MEHVIPLANEGVYLFKAPARLSATINRELVLVVYAEQPSACGVLIFDPRRPVKELDPLLETLVAKMTLGLEQSPGPMEVKLFGLSHNPTGIVSRITVWLQLHGFRLSARDTGRGVTRNLLIRCDSGMVGVSYQESVLPGRPEFLTFGTARSRSHGAVSTQVLILSDSPTHRLLAQQAVEEIEGIVATAPEDPLAFLKGDLADPFPYSCVILFDSHLVHGLGGWIHKLGEASPSTQLIWVGDTTPARVTSTGLTPRAVVRLRPDALGDFKRDLRAILDPDFDTSGDILSFPPEKARR